ncbi:hypothetical protein BBK36DRAFT_473 [Trichoderma citrinoviride]|uniref:Uncharacterized protein n=1 Tax=Trichoderma citrinoviride TaxID=58853 RepID=A0A2T4BMQ5_9HYPO|nr:hypothetical protein BBK36DRAFT_473 [Trichoderma citrinoviride]PTB70605.1 hypothetical protein BBK36DRAFT_473 [Trichoderma citrinoviride]
MAPGYRSPFDHHLPPSIANYNFYHPKATLLVFLAIILCVLSVTVYIELSTIRAIAEEEQHASFREQQQQQHGPKGGSPLPDMTLDRAAMIANYSVVRSGRDPRRAVNIRHLFLREEGYVEATRK